MNKKTLVIKIVEFIHNANVKYKKMDIGDIWLLCILTIISFIFGMLGTMITILIVLCLRAIYEFDILKRLGVINEEENNKKNDEQNFENIR